MDSATQLSAPHDGHAWLGFWPKRACLLDSIANHWNVSSIEINISIKTQSSSSLSVHGKRRCDKSLCISHEPRPFRRRDRLVRQWCRGKSSERELERKGGKNSSNRQFARLSRTRAREMPVKFLIRSADVDLHFVVADAAYDVASEFVAAEFSARVTVHEADFTTGKSQ